MCRFLQVFCKKELIMLTDCCVETNSNNEKWGDGKTKRSYHVNGIILKNFVHEVPRLIQYHGICICINFNRLV
jgi:hypothetical protein